MKKIYEFILQKEEEIDDIQVTKDAAGAEVKTTRKVKKNIPYTYFIARPNRATTDDSEVFRAATESDYIRRGVISANLLQKRLINDGGILSDSEKAEYDTLREKFIKLQGEYSELSVVLEKDRTEEQKTKTESLLKELGDIMGRLNELENASSSLYNRTAEALARNKTILYLVLMLSYSNKDGKETPVFAGKTFEDKLKVYDEIEEREDKFEYELIQKLLFITGIWFMGKATTKEEFDALMIIQANSGLLSSIQ